MKRYTKNSIQITEYTSLNEFLTDITSKPNNRFFEDRHLSEKVEPSNKHEKWYNSYNFTEAANMMTNGWDAAAGKMATKVKLTNSATAAVRSSKPTYGVVGSQASVPRYLQGIPTNMVSRQSTYAKQKVVTITKGISYSAWWSPEAILQESIKALQIIQSMENGGQRVRLNVMWSVSNGSRSHHTVCKVCVKQPDERLNISKMAFALAHPSMLRRLFFKWLETDTFTEYDMGPFYGMPARQEIKDEAMSETEYYIPEEIKDMDELIRKLSEKPGKSRG